LISRNNKFGQNSSFVADEMYDLVQQEFIKRNELRSASKTGRGKYSGKYPFSGIIICGECGATYRRHQQYNRNKKYPTWVCKVHENQGNHKCKAKPIKEDALERAFVNSINNLVDNKEEILARLKAVICDTLTDKSDTRLAEIEEKIQAKQESIVKYLNDRQTGKITEKEYIKLSRQNMSSIDILTLEKQEIESELGKMQLADYRKEEIIKLLNTSDKLDTFDETIFKSLVREIKVTAPKEIEICYNCGLTVKENIK
jgi:hypothetical protein